MGGWRGGGKGRVLEGEVRVGGWRRGKIMGVGGGGKGLVEGEGEGGG